MFYVFFKETLHCEVPLARERFMRNIHIRFEIYDGRIVVPKHFVDSTKALKFSFFKYKYGKGYNSSYTSLLWRAVRNPNYEICRMLIKSIANVNNLLHPSRHTTFNVYKTSIRRRRHRIEVL